jgi:hypothetical protein
MSEHVLSVPFEWQNADPRDPMSDDHCNPGDLLLDDKRLRARIQADATICQMLRTIICRIHLLNRD